MNIHPSAIVDSSAELAADVKVGPFCLIGPHVEIDQGTELLSHAVVKGPCRIGKNNRIFQFASVGEDCQDKKYAGEPTRLEIGDNNIFRECCTIHRGTVQDQGVTRIGSNNLIMAYCHVAHDCQLGNELVLANSSMLAGHVSIDDWAILGGGTLVHQFCRIGAHSMIAGGTTILKDVPAFVTAGGQSASAHGLNLEGLKRRGFASDDIQALKQAYRVIFRQGNTLQQALAELEDHQNHCVQQFVESIKRSERGIIR